MREKIYLAPGANGGELRKSLAMHGASCFNLRICGAGQLARLALMRSGITLPGNFAGAGEELALMAEAAKGESYFRDASYSDIRHLAHTIRRLRGLVPGGDEAEEIARTLSRGIFKEKNEAMISVYRKYQQLLEGKGLLDSVALIRKAAEECGAMDKTDFFTLEEYPLSPLEKALLHRLSGGRARETCLGEMFGVHKVPLKIEGFRNCYGASNEVESILAEIYAGKPLDTCTVAVTDPETYGQLFFDYAILYDMPVTFGCGIPIANSNPARLLALYSRWMTSGFFGASAIEAMLSSEAFDREKLRRLYPPAEEGFSQSVYRSVLGAISLTNDRKTNDQRLADFKAALEKELAMVSPKDEKAYEAVTARKRCLPFLTILAGELARPVEEFIARYACIRKGSDTNARRLLMALDTAAAGAIAVALKTIRDSGVEQTAEEVIKDVLKTMVKTGKSEGGKLFITGIDGALSTVRKNLYIAGLSSSRYPGSPRENYLLLDADIQLFGAEAAYLTSGGRVNRKKQRLLSLVRLWSGLGGSIRVSYAGMNVSELKRDNASSLIYEIYNEASGKNITFQELEAQVEKTGYFAPAISATRKVGEAYAAGTPVVPGSGSAARAAKGAKPDLNREYSPSALKMFFDCPRRFMLSYALGIRERDSSDPFEVMAANEKGTLAHALMEKLADSNMSRDDFLKLSGAYFDHFLAEHPPLVPQKAEAVRGDFLDMMEIAFTMKPKGKVVLKEEELHCVHESGVKLHGYPDRVERLADGSCLVVDFKSGKRVTHVADDIKSCLQIVLYGCLLEQAGYTIAGGEFRYIDLGVTVPCKYDDDMKARLSHLLTEFREHLENADFPVSENADGQENSADDPCKYCQYGLICGKAEEGAAEDEEE